MNRRRLLALTLGVCLSAPAAQAAVGTPTNIGNNFIGTAGLEVDISTTADSPVGNTVFVAFVAGGSSITPAVTDSSGNTYTADTTCVFNTSNKLWVFRAYMTTDLPAGTNNIQVKWPSSSTKGSAAAITVSGITNTSPLDVAPACVTGTSTGAAINPPATTGTLAQADELVLGVTAINSTFSGYNSNSPFTNLTGVTGGNPNVQWGYDLPGATGSLNHAPSWTTNRAYGDLVVSYKGGAVASSRTRSGLLTGFGVGR